MKTKAITDDMLMEYLDGTLDAIERTRIEAACQSDIQIKRRLQAFQRLDNLMLNTLEEASPAFTDEVHKRLQAQEKHVPHYHLKPIMLSLIAMITIITGAYFSTDILWVLNFDRFADTLPTHLPGSAQTISVGVSLQLITIVFLFISSLLALLLLDRAILRPYFLRRRLEAGHS